MNKKKVMALFLGLVMTFTSVPAGVMAEEQGTEPKIVNLKTEGMVEPLGLDEEKPSFSWQMQSDAIGAAQKSYQIVVTDETGAVVWDSGVVESGASHDIPYEGEDLQPTTEYSWKVTVTDEQGNTMESEPASFETAFMDNTRESWDGAQMIGAPDLSLDAASQCIFNISASVQIPEGSSSASFILGADDFRLENAVFNTESMAGENYVRVELDISDVEGSGARIHAYRMGYTADDSADTPVFTIEENEGLNELITPANKNEAHQIDINVSGSIIVISMDGESVGDKFAINPLGDSSSYNSFPNLNSIGFAAKAGETACFTDYKVTNTGKCAQGELFGENTGATYAIFDDMDGVNVDGNVITVDGGEAGVLGYADPTYSAAPMVRREFEAKAGIASARLYLTAEGIYNFYMNGQEVAPEEWFNPGCEEYDAYLAYNTYDVTDMLTEGANAMGAVLGEGWWTGQMTFEASNYNYFGDQPVVMAKLVIEYEDGTSDTVVTDESWSYYNDGPVRLASFFQGERYDATKEAAVEGWTSAGFDASSWTSASIVETRKQFSNAELVTRTDTPVHALYINCLNQAAEIADIMGDTERAEGYRETSAIAKEAWNEMFLDSETGKTKNTKGEIQDTQASYATPLRFGVIRDENMEKVLTNYGATITEASGEDTEGNAIVPYTLTTGFNATGNLLNALSDNGRNEIAYKLFEATDYASWLYPVTQGATSIWERWNSYTEDKAFGGNNAMNSFNHYSFGAVGEWMMGYQLGIKADKEQPGYQHFILQPTVGGTFTQAKGSYDSVYGTIVSGWTASEGVMTSYDVTVPANTSATLYLPAEGTVAECEGVTVTGTAEHNGIQTQQMELVAGTYHFEVAEGEITVTAA